MPELRPLPGRYLPPAFSPRSGELPVRLELVKRSAIEGRLLERGGYGIDAERDQPRSVGVIITAPEVLLVVGQQPTTGTPTMERSKSPALDVTSEMKIRTRAF